MALRAGFTMCSEEWSGRKCSTEIAAAGLTDGTNPLTAAAGPDRAEPRGANYGGTL